MMSFGYYSLYTSLVDKYCQSRNLPFSQFHYFLSLNGTSFTYQIYSFWIEPNVFWHWLFKFFLFYFELCKLFFQKRTLLCLLATNFCLCYRFFQSGSCWAQLFNLFFCLLNSFQKLCQKNELQSDGFYLGRTRRNSLHQFYLNWLNHRLWGCRALLWLKVRLFQLLRIIFRAKPYLEHLSEMITKLYRTSEDV